MMDTTTRATLTTTTDTINTMFISSIPPLSSFVVELGLSGDGCDSVVLDAGICPIGVVEDSVISKNICQYHIYIIIYNGNIKTHFFWT